MLLSCLSSGADMWLRHQRTPTSGTMKRNPNAKQENTRLLLSFHAQIYWIWIVRRERFHKVVRLFSCLSGSYCSIPRHSSLPRLSAFMAFTSTVLFALGTKRCGRAFFWGLSTYRSGELGLGVMLRQSWVPAARKQRWQFTDVFSNVFQIYSSF